MEALNIQREQSKYEQALAKYPTKLDDEEIKKEVANLLSEKVKENNTQEVKKLLLQEVSTLIMQHLAVVVSSVTPH